MVTDAEIRAILEEVVSGGRGRRVRVIDLERRPSAYQTSAALEEIDATLADGERLEMMRKDLGREALLPGARRVKPDFLHDPLREIETYRQVLAVHAPGTAFCHGAVADELTGRYWLFLERVRGVELYQVGELAVWRRVAAWLAVTHGRFAAAGVPARASALHAIRHDAAYYGGWLERARAALAAAPGGAARDLEWLAPAHRAAVDRLSALPATFLHGELYASNVLVQELPAGWRICPIDWEMAAVGPGIFDLAALVAGDWSDRDRGSIVSAYYDALPDGATPWGSRDAFATDLELCRILIAVQWLGWFGVESPPDEHARDWLGEAIATARRLGW